MYTVVSLTKNECLSGGNCSYIVRLSVRDLHGPTQRNYPYIKRVPFQQKQASFFYMLTILDYPFCKKKTWNVSGSGVGQSHQPEISRRIQPLKMKSIFHPIFQPIQFDKVFYASRLVSLSNENFDLCSPDEVYTFL